MLQAERDAADERVKILERSEAECAVLRAAARGRLDQAAKFIVERIG